MASKWPPVKNAAYTFRCVLFAQSDNQIKSNPTIASGDWKISIDGGAFANLATLPDVDPDSSVQVKVVLSSDEMNGDEIMVTGIDASGDEWHSVAFVIHTVGQTLDAMDTVLDSRASQTSVDDIPTNSEFNARTLPAADYFDPAADTVANVTTVGTVTNAVTAGTVSDKTGYSLHGDYDAAKTAASQTSVDTIDDLVDDLETRLTAARAGYLDKLNVAGTLAHSGAADTYKADVSLLALEATAQAILGDTGTDGVVISNATMLAIADEVLKRGVSNVEDDADTTSLAAIILATLESSVSGTTWTIRKTGGGSFVVKTLTTDSDAEPVVGVT